MFDYEIIVCTDKFSLLTFLMMESRFRSDEFLCFHDGLKG